MILPAHEIDRIFRMMAATYGSAWDRSLGGAPIADVKAVWTHKLSGFAAHIAAIDWALDNLPAKIPNVIEFLQLCRQAPSPKPLQIDGPKPVPPPADVRNAMQAIVGKKPDFDRLGWAKAHVAAHEAGGFVRPVTLKLAKAALRNDRT